MKAASGKRRPAPTVPVNPLCLATDASDVINASRAALKVFFLGAVAQVGEGSNWNCSPRRHAKRPPRSRLGEWKGI
jgi:hypothetical protein